MTAAPTIAELRALSDREIIERYDANAGQTTVGVGFYLDELARRDARHQGELIVCLNAIITLDHDRQPGVHRVPGDPRMSTWISRPAELLSREWHLEAAANPGHPGLVHGACGRTWAPSASDRLERTDDLAGIRESDRCPACEGVYTRRLSQ